MYSYSKHTHMAILASAMEFQLTHWVTGCDHSIDFDDVTMIELSHGGSFLQEFDPVFLSCSHLQRFDGYFKYSRPISVLQLSTVHNTKLTTAELLL